MKRQKQGDRENEALKTEYRAWARSFFPIIQTADAGDEIARELILVKRSRNQRPLEKADDLAFAP